MAPVTRVDAGPPEAHFVVTRSTQPERSHSWATFSGTVHCAAQQFWQSIRPLDNPARKSVGRGFEPRPPHLAVPGQLVRRLEIAAVSGVFRGVVAARDGMVTAERAR